MKIQNRDKFKLKMDYDDAVILLLAVEKYAKDLEKSDLQAFSFFTSQDTKKKEFKNKIRKILKTLEEIH